MKAEDLPRAGELTVISDRADQAAAFSDLSERLVPLFVSRQSGSWNDVLYGYKDHANAVYGLEIWLRGAWVGCSLNGPLPNDFRSFRSLLQFATFSEQSGSRLVAGRLARGRGQNYLLHDGRVHSDGRGSPSTQQVYQLEGKNFYLVSELSSNRFVDDLITFHRSRLNPPLGLTVPPPIAAGGYDPGSSRGGHRSAADFSAHHHPITTRLRDIVEGAGFRPLACPIFSPDLLVKRDDHTILFEVKPQPDLHDLIGGCGQLLLYNQCAGADQLVLVTKPLTNSATTSELRKYMSRQGIKLATYTTVEAGITFHNLSSCLARE